MGAGLVDSGEDTSRLDDELGTILSPWDLSGVLPVKYKVDNKYSISTCTLDS